MFINSSQDESDSQRYDFPVIRGVVIQTDVSTNSTVVSDVFKVRNASDTEILFKRIFYRETDINSFSELTTKDSLEGNRHYEYPHIILRKISFDLNSNRLVNLIEDITKTKVMAVENSKRRPGTARIWLADPTQIDIAIERLNNKIWFPPIYEPFAIEIVNSASKKYLDSFLSIFGSLTFLRFHKHLMSAEKCLPMVIPD